MENSYKNYLKDLIVLISEKANELKHDIESLEKIDEFKKGQMFTYYEIVDLLKSQAEVFEIKESEIGLNKIKSESYLL